MKATRSKESSQTDSYHAYIRYISISNKYHCASILLFVIIMIMKWLRSSVVGRTLGFQWNEMVDIGHAGVITTIEQSL